MKKTVLIIAALGMTYMGMAQEKYVTSALTALNQKSLDEAKTDIDRAMSSPETNQKPRTLLAKAQIYYSLDRDPKYESQKYWKDAAQALLKLVEIKPDYEKESVNPVLYFVAGMYFNDGVNAYNDKKNAEAIAGFKEVLKIHDLGNGKRFEKMPFALKFDTIAANANMLLASTAISMQNFEEAISLFNKVKADKITKNADCYIKLLESYDKYNTNNNNKLANEEMAAVAEARKEYPNDPNIRNMELNCYLKNNKLNELVKKLEENAAKEPNSADVHYNMGLVYQGLANPKDGPKPANAAEYNSKAEKAFAEAVKLAPENANYNYNYGVIYYMQAFSFNEQMNNITGTTKLELAKYDELKAKRDAMFEKSLPGLEKATDILSAKDFSSMRPDDKDTYHDALTALKQIYAVQNKSDKVTDVVKKLKKFEE